MTDTEFIAACHQAKLPQESLDLMLRLRRLAINGQDFAAPEIWAELIRNAQQEAGQVLPEFRDFHAEVLARGLAHFTENWPTTAAKAGP